MVEGEESARARVGTTAVIGDVFARAPLLSPQMRHGHSVCLTTPHPLHLFRSEHGYAQVMHGLVEDGPKVVHDPWLQLGREGSSPGGQTL